MHLSHDPWTQFSESSRYSSSSEKYRRSNTDVSTISMMISGSVLTTSRLYVKQWWKHAGRLWRSFFHLPHKRSNKWGCSATNALPCERDFREFCISLNLLSRGWEERGETIRETRGGCSETSGWLLLLSSSERRTSRISIWLFFSLFFLSLSLASLFVLFVPPPLSPSCSFAAVKIARAHCWTNNLFGTSASR